MKNRVNHAPQRLSFRAPEKKPIRIRARLKSRAATEHDRGGAFSPRGYIKVLELRAFCHHAIKRRPRLAAKYESEATLSSTNTIRTYIAVVIEIPIPLPIAK